MYGNREDVERLKIETVEEGNVMSYKIVMDSAENCRKAIRRTGILNVCR